MQVQFLLLDADISLFSEAMQTHLYFHPGDEEESRVNRKISKGAFTPYVDFLDPNCYAL